MVKQNIIPIFQAQKEAMKTHMQAHSEGDILEMFGELGLDQRTGRGVLAAVEATPGHICVVDWEAKTYRYVPPKPRPTTAVAPRPQDGVAAAPQKPGQTPPVSPPVRAAPKPNVALASPGAKEADQNTPPTAPAIAAGHEEKTMKRVSEVKFAELVQNAREQIITTGAASGVDLRTVLKIGPTTMERVFEKLEKEKVIGPSGGRGSRRKVLIGTTAGSGGSPTSRRQPMDAIGPKRGGAHGGMTQEGARILLQQLANMFAGTPNGTALVWAVEAFEDHAKIAELERQNNLFRAALEKMVGDLALTLRDVGEKQ